MQIDHNFLPPQNLEFALRCQSQINLEHFNESSSGMMLVEMAASIGDINTIILVPNSEKTDITSYRKM